MIGIRLDNEAFLDEHYEAIYKYFNRKYIHFKYKDIDAWVKQITGNDFTFEKVIKATPSELKVIIQKVDSVNKYKDSPIGKYMVYVYTKFSTATDEHFNEIKYGALKLVSNLGLKVCPYCNRNFITNTKLFDKNKKPFIKRTAQLDHFYPESKYPYLALSFYNLIPACSSCNMIKWQSPIGLNPHEIVNSDEHIIFDYSFDHSLEIVVDTIYMSNVFKENWITLGLEELYKSHSDYLSDMILRMKIYNSLYRKDLNNYFDKLDNNSGETGLEFSKEDFERVILGNYFLEKDLHKRPLSKLTKDIYRQYK